MFLIFPVLSVVKFWKQKSFFRFSISIPKFRRGFCTGSVFLNGPTIRFFFKKKECPPGKARKVYVS